jgi:hypothetical protein
MLKTLVLKNCWASVPVRSANALCGPTMPALLISTSSCPICRASSATAVATDASSATSSSTKWRRVRQRLALAALGVAGTEMDLMALGDESSGGLVAESLVAAGDQGVRHASSLAARRPSATGRVDPAVARLLSGRTTQRAVRLLRRGDENLRLSRRRRRGRQHLWARSSPRLRCLYLGRCRAGTYGQARVLPRVVSGSTPSPRSSRIERHRSR